MVAAPKSSRRQHAVGGDRDIRGTNEEKYGIQEQRRKTRGVEVMAGVQALSVGATVLFGCVMRAKGKQKK